MAKKKVDKTEDDKQRDFWTSKGGSFHDPNGSETGTMSEAKLLPLLRDLRYRPKVSWSAPLPGSKIGVARMLTVDGQPISKFERWEEDTSLDAADRVLRTLATRGAIDYERVKEEWPLG